MSSTGLISGTPVNNTTANFTVRVSDYIARAAFQNFTLTPTGSVLGTALYPNGSLILDNGTVFTTYKNTKSGFSNMGAFTGLGFKWNNVATGNTASLVNSGFVISTANMAHPWGSWIKNGSIIYFVHDQGLIPIPSMDIFLNNGGQLSMIINANGYDFTKPLLPIMTYNDLRLKL